MTQKNVEGTCRANLDAAGGELRFALVRTIAAAASITSPITASSPTTASRTTRPSRLRARRTSARCFGELLVPVLKDLPFIQELSSIWALDGPVRPVRRRQYLESRSELEAGVYRLCARRLCQGDPRSSLGELFAPTVTGNLNIGAGPSAGDPCATGSVFRSAPAPLKSRRSVRRKVFRRRCTRPIRTASTRCTHSGGNPKLTPETANTYSVGTVWSPHFDSDLMRKFRCP